MYVNVTSLMREPLNVKMRNESSKVHDYLAEKLFLGPNYWLESYEAATCYDFYHLSVNCYILQKR